MLFRGIPAVCRYVCLYDLTAADDNNDAIE